MTPQPPELPYPHYVDHTNKTVSIYFEAGFPSTMACHWLTNKYFPGYAGLIVSAPVLEKLRLNEK
jgi:hypothetical protein